MAALLCVRADQRRKVMHISERIQAIVNMVSSGHAVCDVGCDHAYTSIALVTNGKCPYAVASDVRPGPLAAAKTNIVSAGVGDRIEVCLYDGVPADVHERLPAGKRTLIITGMGGMLICQILERAGEKAAAFDEMVLSPQSDPDRVRYLLAEMGFIIKDETMLIDEGKFYVVMRAEHAKGICPNLTQAEALYGPVLLKKQDPVLRTYLARQENVFKKVKDSLRKAGRGPGDERYREISEEQEVLIEACRYYEDN